MSRQETTSTGRNALSIAERIADECLAVRVRLLNRTITGIYDEALRPLGMTAGQLNVLTVVGKLGVISQSDVARRLNMEKSTSSRNIERMRRHGWIGVSPSDSGRSPMLSLRPKGQRQLERALPLWKAAQVRAKEVLGQRGARSLCSVADTVWTRIDRE